MNWIWLLFEGFCACFEIIMLKALVVGFLKNERTLPFSVKAITFAVAIMVSFFVSVFLSNNFIALFSKTFLLGFALASVFCKSKIYWKVISACFWYLMGTTELLAAYLITLPQGAKVGAVVELGWYRYQALAVSNILIFIIVKIIVRIRMSKTEALPMKIWLPLCIMPIFSILISLQIVFDSAGSDSQNILLPVISIIGLMYMNIIVFSTVEGVVRQFKNRERLTLLEAQLVVQKEHNARFADMREQFEIMLHDFKHRVQSFQILCENGQYDELLAGIRTLTLQQNSIKPQIDTKNMLLDALLTNKRDKAEQAGIICTWEISIPPEMPLPSIELCDILGNALDNAIETCLRTETKRFIATRIFVTENALLCEIRNTTGELPKEKNGDFQTLKRDEKNHGLGILSMRQCCKRLNGEMSIEFDAKVFELRIILPFNVIRA